ncbi:hypothetical protein D3C75_1356950 [compost metagenome]
MPPSVEATKVSLLSPGLSGISAITKVVLPPLNILELLTITSVAFGASRVRVRPAVFTIVGVFSLNNLPSGKAIL